MDLSRNQQEETNLSIPRIPTLSPAEALAKEGNSIAIPTVDPSITANWKTYTNNEQGYSIKYPPEWFIGKDSLFDGNVIGAIRTSPVEEKETSALRIEIHTGNFSYERYAYTYHLFPKASPNTLDEININGAVWEKYSNSDDLSANNNLYVLGTTHNNKKYFLIKRVSPESKNAKKESMLIEQILSTFKFTQ